MREMPQARNSLLPELPIHDSRDEGDISPLRVSIIVDFLRRNRRLVMLVTVLVTALGLIYTFSVSPKYTATTKLLIDYVHAQIGEGSTAVVDQGAVDSQVELLKSETVILSMIKDLKLDQDEERVSDALFPASWSMVIQRFFDGVGLGFLSHPANGTSGTRSAESPQGQHGDQPNRRARTLVDRILANLWVSRVGKSYIVDISYTSPDPAEAAQIANGVARAYMAEQVAAKRTAAREQTAWLLSRVQELQKQAAQAAKAVQTFRMSHSVMPSQALDLDAEATKLDQQRAKADETLESSRQQVRQLGTLLAAVDRLPDPVQKADARAPLAALIGPDESISRAALKNRIQAALKPVVAAEAEQARVQASIQRKIADLDRRRHQMELDQAKVRDLETAAATSRSLQESFLNQFTVAARQQSFPSSDARVVAEAATPLYRAYPRRGITVILSAAVGVVLGLGLALFREQIDDKIRTRSSLEERTGILCIGYLLNRKGAGTLQRCTEAEIDALRSIQSAADLCSPSGPKVIAITSCLAQEGKSTVALLLATLLAKWGRSTLLVDCGRQGELSRMVIERWNSETHPDNASGMGFNYEKVDDGLSLLSVGAEELRRVDIQKIMEAVIENATNDYEYIVVDCPTLLEPGPLRGMTSWIGLGVVVARWGTVSVEQIERGLGRSGLANCRYVCAVLNRVNLRRMKSWEGSKAALFAGDES